MMAGVQLLIQIMMYVQKKKNNGYICILCAYNRKDICFIQNKWKKNFEDTKLSTI